VIVQRHRRDGRQQRMVLWLACARCCVTRPDLRNATVLPAEGHVVGVLQHQVALATGWQRTEYRHAPLGGGAIAHHILVPRAGDGQHRTGQPREGLRRISQRGQAGRERDERRQPRLLHTIVAHIPLAGHAQRGVGAEGMAAHPDAGRAHL
jgi:hypothetical protein